MGDGITFLDRGPTYVVISLGCESQFIHQEGSNFVFPGWALQVYRAQLRALPDDDDREQPDGLLHALLHLLDGVSHAENTA